MAQTSLPGVKPHEHIVNVSSIPLRSPFRYPGGKTWLVPRIRRWLHSFDSRPVELIEPFAGGAIVGLTAIFEGLADRVTLVELDDEVAAVWQTIIQDDKGEWLSDQILSFDMKIDSVRDLLSRKNLSIHDQALNTIVKNRVNRGGILAPGAGKFKHGDNGKGLASRWYPKTLCRRIMAISGIRERITFIHGDGIEIIRNCTRRSDAVYFIDPPYTVAGKRAGSRLYRHSKLNHEELFRLASTLEGDFLMTYENAEEVQALAGHYGLECKPVAMKNTHHEKLTELVIGRNLDFIG